MHVFDLWEEAEIPRDNTGRTCKRHTQMPNLKLVNLIQQIPKPHCKYAFIVNHSLRQEKYGDCTMLLTP